MTERGILFSAPMVRALLDGSKTQTRRVVKQNGKTGQAVYDHPIWQVKPTAEPRFSGHSHDFWRPDAERVYSALPPCPYGQPGDRLWVRETFAYLGTNKRGPYVYRANTADGERVRVDAPWVPSIHMPRAASRILLEITGVRVERLQGISDQDAIAEGISRVGPGWERWHPDPADTEHTGSTQDPRLSYRGLWESINGAGNWDANPWVWVVEFRRIES